MDLVPTDLAPQIPMPLLWKVPYQAAAIPDSLEKWRMRRRQASTALRARRRMPTLARTSQ